MKRILGTTAIILSLTGPAFADAHAAGFGTVTAQETDFFASDLIGMRIYNSETEVEANSTIAADGDRVRFAAAIALSAAAFCAWPSLPSLPACCALL